MTDLDKVVGSFDVSDNTTGISFNLLNPNNPIFLLDIPGMEKDPFYVRGNDFKTFADVLKSLNLNINVELTTDDENTVETVKLDFEKMSDFQFKEIKTKLTALKTLSDQIQAASKIIEKQRLDKILKLYDESGKKEDFIEFLNEIIAKL